MSLPKLPLWRRHTGKLLRALRPESGRVADGAPSDPQRQENLQLLPTASVEPIPNASALPTAIQKSLALAEGLHIVLAPPKTGSTAVRATLEALDLPGLVYKVHSLDRGMMLNPDLWRQTTPLPYGRAVAFSEMKFHWKVAGLLDLYRELGTRLPEQMQATDLRPNLLVTLREPVARYLSALFFYIHSLYGSEGRIMLTQEYVEQRMRENAEFPVTIGMRNWWSLEDWLDRELDRNFGLDIFAQSFHAERGWQIYTNAAIRLLVIRQENLSALPAALSEFYDICAEDCAVPQTNPGEENAYADIYREVKQLLRLPAERLQEVYSSRYAQHFYTDVERARFQQRWVKDSL